MGQRESYRILLAPFPLTALAVFGYYLVNARGLVDEKTEIFYYWRPNKQYKHQIVGENLGACLFGRDYVSRLIRLLRTEPVSPADFSTSLLERYLNFFQSPRGSGCGGLRLLEAYLARNACFLDQILPKAAALLETWIKSGLDPFRNELPARLSPIPKLSELKLPASSHHMTLPLFRTNKPMEHRIVGKERMFFDEARIGLLSGQHLGIVLGGPPNSGKSTCIASLVEQMQNIVVSLQSRPGWSGFQLSVGLVNLDLATPTAEQVFAMKELGAGDFNSRRRTWTKDLAFEALHAFEAAKKKYNVVLADLPGKIDILTEIMSVPADAGILLTRDWQKMAEWQTFLRNMGIRKIVQARTRSAEQSLPSIVKRFNSGREVAGRISGLERIVCPWDPFVHFLSYALLFDLLPAMVEGRRKILSKHLEHNSRT